MRTTDNLREWFAGSGSAMVALSGGVDSALVAYAAATTPGVSSLAVTANYRTLSAAELDSAREVAAQIGIRHHILEYDELANEDFVRNDQNRCYHCRTELGDRLRNLAFEMNYRVIVDGANADDTAEYRPGMRAIRERGIRSPLLELGMSKDDIRRLAKDAGLAVHDRPSDSCLASRIPWGRRVTAQLLARVEMGERYVRRVVPAGPVRVRDMDGVARIEVTREAIPALLGSKSEVSSSLMALGFTGVEVDPDGYSPGGANRR